MPNLTDPKIFQNITKPIKYRASYEKRDFTVTWNNWDGTQLKTETIGMHMSATPPTNPTRDGYTFSGWDKTYSVITSNTTITALYTLVPATMYTVKWLNWDGSLLKEEKVEKGKSATPPSTPTRTDYTFKNWDSSYSSIASDVSIKAVFESNIKKIKITFEQLAISANSEGGRVLISEVELDEGTIPTFPTPPTITDMSFAGWLPAKEKATEDTTYSAVYYPSDAPTIYMAAENGEYNSTDLLTTSSYIVHAGTGSKLYEYYEDSVFLGFGLRDLMVYFYAKHSLDSLISWSVTGCGAIVYQIGYYRGPVVKFTSTGTATFKATNKLSGKSTTVSVKINRPNVVFGTPIVGMYQTFFNIGIERNKRPSSIGSPGSMGDTYPEQTATVVGTSSNKSIVENAVFDPTMGQVSFKRVTGATGTFTITVTYKTPTLTETKTWNLEYK